MKKSLNTDQISNDLNDLKVSRHFSTPKNALDSEEKKVQDDSMLANKQGSKEAKKQASNQVSNQSSKVEKMLTSKPLKKYASYLPEDLLRQIRVYAASMDKEMYEVIQKAVEEYLEANKFTSK